ncbi:hypothetical protein [Streptomyces sp. NPDC096152]|uniref:hypothetical protein n=1 Tax=Streptomyces sp. NPDC096152 TaxID=3366078 RepID=UPI0038021D29
MTTASSEALTERIPGRSWTVRLTGHADRTATVTCSIAACRMPARSRDLAALRAFAARHAAAHARAATVRANASCHCRAEHCEAHPQATVHHCTGGVLLILRHDATVGRVWVVEEVCESCAPLIPHASVVGRAQRRPTPVVQRAETVPAPDVPRVPGGFSSAGAADTGPQPARRPRRSPRPPRGRSSRQGR